MSKVLVTGAGGFIGSHLVESLLSDGNQVNAFVRYVSSGNVGFLEGSADQKELTIFRGNLMDPDSVQNACRGCETIYHLGAHISIPYSAEAPRDVFQSNVTMTLNVLAAARAQGVERVVITSTSEVYGNAASLPIHETHPLHPQSVYAASKVACDQLALAWYRQFTEPEIVILRPFNTYGPRQSQRAVIPTIICQALSGSILSLGNTRTSRDFLFVSDTVSAFLLAGKKENIGGEIIQVGTGIETSIIEVVEQVSQILGKSLTIQHESVRMRGATEEVNRLQADFSKAERMLDWHPQISFGEGLKRTVEYYKNNPRYLPHDYLR